MTVLCVIEQQNACKIYFQLSIVNKQDRIDYRYCLNRNDLNRDYHFLFACLNVVVKSTH